MDSYLTGQADMLRCGDGTYVLTSDYGYLDADGRLFIAGRADSLDTVLLESELKELPGVRDVCTARRERDDATEIVACVMPDPAREGAPGAIGRRLGDLLAASGAKYDDYSVAEIPTIPYNTAGKVDVRALNALLDDSRLPTA